MNQPRQAVLNEKDSKLMKEKRKYYKINIVLVALFTIIIGSALYYFGRVYSKFRTERASLVEKELNGYLSSLGDERRGAYFLEIETKIEKVVIHSLPIAWEIKEYHIQVGDSVSKLSNSKIINVYRFQNGVYSKYCEFEI